MAARLCGKASRSGADDDYIVCVGRSTPVLFFHGIDSLAALFDCIPNQSHATEFTGDEYTGHVCLKIRANIGDVDAALLRTENQRNRVARANVLAGTVADAVAGLDQFCLSVDHAKDVAFGAGADASPAAYAF